MDLLGNGQAHYLKLLPPDSSANPRSLSIRSTTSVPQSRCDGAVEAHSKTFDGSVAAGLGEGAGAESSRRGASSPRARPMASATCCNQGSDAGAAQHVADATRDARRGGYFGREMFFYSRLFLTTSVRRLLARSAACASAVSAAAYELAFDWTPASLQIFSRLYLIKLCTMRALSVLYMLLAMFEHVRQLTRAPEQGRSVAQVGARCLRDNGFVSQAEVALV